MSDFSSVFQSRPIEALKALRLSAQTGEAISDSIKNEIMLNKDALLKADNAEAFSELTLLVCGDYCENVLLEFRDVIAVLLPEISASFNFAQNSKWHIYDVYTHIVKSTACVDSRAHMRLAMLFHDIGKPFCKKTDAAGQDHFKGHPVISARLAEDILQRFNADDALKAKVLTLIRHHDEFIYPNEESINKWIEAIGSEMTLDYIDFKIADLKTHNLELSQHEIDALRETREIAKTMIKKGNTV